MVFAGLNYLAILVAALAGFGTGAVWYMSLSKPWLAASGFDTAGMPRSSKTPFAVSIVSLLVMAWVLAGVVGHLGPGQVTVKNGVISAAFLWLGFIATTTATNYAFGQRRVMLTVIDTAHWLLVMLVMGAVVGAFGV